MSAARQQTDSDSTDLQSIRPFFPLDPAADFRPEETLAPDRGGLQLQRQPGSGWRTLTRAELAAVVAVPALIVLGILLGASGAPPAVVVSSIGVLICGLAAFAVSGRRREV